ncbi:NAR1 ribosyltransferase, partial [Pycnonotus jocosus]|nr:NAR1 ribosyltransferase [Pycnonotus jocosus]
WPLSAMAPLALTLALLAMTVAPAANEVLPLDMAQDSFDDQYRGCGPAMTAALPALIRSEFQKNPVFAQAWPEAKTQWHKVRSPMSPLPSPAHAIALRAYMIPDLYTDFNRAVPVAGRSPQQYRDNFHFKSLHFLLTDAVATLRDARKGRCLQVVRRDCGVRFEAKLGDTVRFGQFWVMWMSETPAWCPVQTLFRLYTCHGGGMQYFLKTEEEVVLIPPFETFEVTEVTREGNKTQIQLNSTGTFSKYNCEWLRGDSTGDSLG